MESTLIASSFNELEGIGGSGKGSCGIPLEIALEYPFDSGVGRTPFGFLGKGIGVGVEGECSGTLH